MAERSATIASKVGLHARPASIFVKAAAKAEVPVTIRKGEGAGVDASSILAVMTLGAEQGDVVTLSAEGEGAVETLEELVTLLSRELDT